ncbi:Uncharacterised protein [Vibrio cholerae]|nr:Uncharacterised protein [Vibrio cholerae]
MSKLFSDTFFRELYVNFNASFFRKFSKHRLNQKRLAIRVNIDFLSGKSRRGKHTERYR